MSEMVERVAKAIHTLRHSTRESQARAAIEAMREPTDAQYQALSATDKMWRELSSYEVWTTYIDAALK